MREFLRLGSLPPGEAPAPAERLPNAIWTAVDAAGRALYAAKAAGRNRVVVSRPASRE